jgi:bile acid-coenzyme A ligase
MAYWAERAPDKLAITHDDQSITRAEFDARTNRLARAYAEMGVQPDDFVTIGLPNSIAFFEAAFAVWKLGAPRNRFRLDCPKASATRSLRSQTRL